MKTYAKVDSEGNVIQFPYREAMNLRPIQTLPEDAVEVDTRSQKPQNLKWYEGIWYDRVERQGSNYVVFYRKGEKKWSSPDDKKNTLRTLVKMARMDVDKLEDDNEKKSKHAILDSIDPEDPNTYDDYHKLGV